jgi:threonyl-tRNA synthetase
MKMPDSNPPGFVFGLANLTPPAPPAAQITVTFPDGAAREFAAGITGFEIAKGISPSPGSTSSTATTRARWS